MPAGTASGPQTVIAKKADGSRSAVRIALGLGLAFFACTQLIPALGLGWSDVVCLGANSNPPQTARTDE